MTLIQLYNEVISIHKDKQIITTFPKIKYCCLNSLVTRLSIIPYMS